QSPCGLPPQTFESCSVGQRRTTLNQPVEQDLQMLKDLGLDPSWDNHGFSDQEETGCGCGKENCETKIAENLVGLR
ncbi:MAG: hypothetical protein ACREC8_05405, partial [Limisphaerales bacterium]